MSLLNKNKWKLILSFCLVVIVAAVSFFPISSAISSRLVSAEDQPPINAQPKDVGFLQPSTPEEASQIAGYTVVTPSFLPAGTIYHHNISIEEPLFDAPRQVTQFWNYGKHFYICLIQDPKLEAIGGGEVTETNINGIVGQRQLIQATATSPARVGLFWKQTNMSYWLIANMTDIVNETNLYKIASSIK